MVGRAGPNCGPVNERIIQMRRLCTRHAPLRRTPNRWSRSVSARTAIAAAATAAMFGSLILAAVAQAHVCSVNEGFHCYSISTWFMEKPEEVRGGYLEVQTINGYVPNYTTEFLDNEMWVGFTQKEHSWVEGGVTVGDGTGGASKPAWFLAQSYGPKSSQYFEYIYPEGPAYSSWSGLYLWEPELNGTWCAMWAWDTKPDFCYSGFPHSSTDVENGLEFATTAASGAYNDGNDSTWAEWMNGTWKHEWNDGKTHAEGEREKPLCIIAPISGYAYGSIAYSAAAC